MDTPTHYCNNCKDPFDNPVYIEEVDDIDYGIGRRWVTTFKGWVCPYCESDDIEDYDPEDNLNDESTEAA